MSDPIYLITASGAYGHIDASTGAMYVPGYSGPVAWEPDLSETVPVVETETGRFGHRIKRGFRRVVKAAPLRRLAGKLGGLANSPVIKAIGSNLPPPYGPAFAAAGPALSVASKLGRGNPQARQQMQNMALMALDKRNPQVAAQARQAIQTVQDIRHGQLSSVAQQSIQNAQQLQSLVRRIRHGDPSARRLYSALVSSSWNNPQNAAIVRAIQAGLRAAHA